MFHRVIICLFLFWSVPSYAQEAREVLAKCVDAYGGLEELKAIRSCYIKSKTTVPEHSWVGYNFHLATHDRKQRSESTSPTGKTLWISAYDGIRARYRSDSFPKNVSASDFEGKAFLCPAIPGLAQVVAALEGTEPFEYLGNGKSPDFVGHLFRFDGHGEASMDVVIDPVSFMIRNTIETNKSNQIRTVMSIEAMHAVEGIPFPERIEVASYSPGNPDPVDGLLEYTEIRLNVRVDPEVFENLDLAMAKAIEDEPARSATGVAGLDSPIGSLAAGWPSGVMKDQDVDLVLDASGSKEDIRNLMQVLADHDILSQSLKKERLETTEQFVARCRKTQAGLDGSVDAWIGNRFVFDTISNSFRVDHVDPERGFIVLQVLNGLLIRFPILETMSKLEWDYLRRRVQVPDYVDKKGGRYNYSNPEDFAGRLHDGGGGPYLIITGERKELERILDAVDGGSLQARIRNVLLPGHRLPDSWTVPHEFKFDYQYHIDHRGVLGNGGSMAATLLHAGKHGTYQLALENPEKRAERNELWAKKSYLSTLSYYNTRACIVQAAGAIELYIDGSPVGVFRRPYSD